MRALVFERSLPRYAAARLASALAPGRGARVGPLSLIDVDEPALPGSAWQRVRPRLAGICGSDLATVDGRSSRYFEPIVSFPFVPGHEVVGDLDDGTRVVVRPVLSCATRGIDPPCDWCANDSPNRCERVAFGHLPPGLQSGYCKATGGGWSLSMVAHESQLHVVPDDMTDEEAVMVEPVACAIHAARQLGEWALGKEVVVIGSGTLGLCTIAALRAAPRSGIEPMNCIAAAKYPEQRRLALELGADTVVSPAELHSAVRSRTGAFRLGDQLTCGADHVVDCVGSADSLRTALEIVAPGGTVLLVGMAGNVTLDLTTLWHRESAIRGSYAYTREDFAAAFDLVREAKLGRLVSALYPLEGWRDAIEHAADAGRRGAVKIAFDLRQEKRR